MPSSSVHAADKGIVINSPCNPTGALVEERDLAGIAERSGSRGIWILLDLCYERLIYDRAAQPSRRPRRAHARPRGALRLGVEGLCDDRLALRLGRRPGGSHQRLQRDTEPRDVERQFDHTEERRPPP